jgi:hypothetical protein
MRALDASAVQAGRLVCCTRSSPSSRSVVFSVSLQYQTTPWLPEPEAEVEFRAAAWQVERVSAAEASDSAPEVLDPALTDTALTDTALAAGILIVPLAALLSFLPFG